MTEDCDGHCGDDGRGRAPQDAEPEHEVPVPGRLGQQHVRGHAGDRSGHQQGARPIPIEQRPNLDAQEQRQKHEQGRDPSDVADAVLAQLVGADVVLHRPDWYPPA